MLYLDHIRYDLIQQTARWLRERSACKKQDVAVGGAAMSDSHPCCIKEWPGLAADVRAGGM
jgi:hypothetical protein